MSVKRPLNQFSSDRPIESKAGDLLGRTSFAESLADIVEGWLGNDSLVMALWGFWGIGKSSIKNMVVEHLRRNTAYAATIVQFTPWQWAAQDQISEAFFREIALALGKKDEAKKKKSKEPRCSVCRLRSISKSRKSPSLWCPTFGSYLFGVGRIFRYRQFGALAFLAENVWDGHWQCCLNVGSACCLVG
jgi:hypothetical protein